MSGMGVVFVAVGLLVALRPSAAARYPDSAPDGRKLARYVAAPTLVAFRMLLSLGTTIQ